MTHQEANRSPDPRVCEAGTATGDRNVSSAFANRGKPAEWTPSNGCTRHRPIQVRVIGEPDEGLYYWSGREDL